MPRNFFRFSFLLSAIVLASCKDDTPLEGAPVELRVADRTVTLQLGNCRVYKVEKRLLRAPRKTRVLTTDFYFGFTACSRQSLVKQGDYAIASLCRQAIGAGGGCASGGTYRTRDGEKWEVAMNDGRWMPVAEPPAEETPPPATPAPAQDS